MVGIQFLSLEFDRIDDLIAFPIIRQGIRVRLFGRVLVAMNLVLFPR